MYHYDSILRVICYIKCVRRTLLNHVQQIFSDDTSAADRVEIREFVSLRDVSCEIW